MSEEALHVGSGCEAFHLETNAFPVQWAFLSLSLSLSLSQASVCGHVCLRKKMHRDRDSKCVCVCVQEAMNIESDCYRVGKCA